MKSDFKVAYHEIDFLVPAQKFNIQFSYVSKKGLSFIREFLLRLIHVAPMSKFQLSTFFGLSRRETEEAISDLVQRSELTLSADGLLTLTDKAKSYFPEIGGAPQLSIIQDSGAYLSFDMATLTCFSSGNVKRAQKSGLFIKVDDKILSQSQMLVGRQFQYQFNKILDKGFLPNVKSQDVKDIPTVYTVKSVDKLQEFHIALNASFEMNSEGVGVERQDYDEFNNSEVVHENISLTVSRMLKANNTVSIFKSMVSLGDEDTIKLFDSGTNLIIPSYVQDLQTLEWYGTSGRATFLGPIYSKQNWDLLQKMMTPILDSRIKVKKDQGSDRFIWISPSDPFWGKSARFVSCLSDFLGRSKTKDKKIYNPTLYVPVAGFDDARGARQWARELGDYKSDINGLVDGFLDGNVEFIYLENEIVVVTYHFSHPGILPVTMPLGFISTSKAVVNRIGALITGYVDGSSAFDKKNDCGNIELMSVNR